MKKNQKILSPTPRLRELLDEHTPSKKGTEDNENHPSIEIIFPKIFYRYFTSIDKSTNKLKFSLYEYASRYSKLRVDWFLAESDQKSSIDEERRLAHNSFIDACNILSRNMIKNGEDASWRKELGDDRKVIGDFACYISFVLGIRAR